MRRLRERDIDYLEALNVSNDKCLNSYFCRELFVDMLEITKQWKERFGPPKNNKNKTSLKKTLANDRELIEQPSPTLTCYISKTNLNF